MRAVACEGVAAGKLAASDRSSDGDVLRPEVEDRIAQQSVGDDDALVGIGFPGSQVARQIQRNHHPIRKKTFAGEQRRDRGEEDCGAQRRRISEWPHQSTFAVYRWVRFCTTST